MVTVPNLPTDNLYKFAAISGLIMMVAGAAAPLFILQSEMEWSYGQFKEIAIATAQNRKDREKLAVEVAASENDKVKEIVARGDEWSEQNVHLQYLLPAQEQHTELMKAQLASCGRLHFIGIFVSVIGFITWFVRVQRVQDRILRIELLKAERSISIDGNSGISPG